MLSALPNGLVRVGLAAALALAAQSHARADNPEELGVLVQHPSDPAQLLIKYERKLGGILFSDDGGHTFRVHPGMGFTTYGWREYVKPPLLQHDGTLLAPSPEGLFASKGVCLQPHPRASVDEPVAAPDGVATAVAPHPSVPNVSFYLTNDLNTTRSGLWRRAADGKVSAQGAVNDGQAFDARDLRVVKRAASAGGLRFLELGLRERAPILRISDSEGDSWQELPIDVPNATDGDPRFVALLPGEPMTLVVVIEKTASTDPPDLVLISRDGGQTFSTYVEPIVRLIQSLVLPDGRLFLADQGGNTATAGLWMASAVGEPPVKLVDYPVHCIGPASEENTLLLCKRYELGRFDLTSNRYCRMFQLNEVRDFACDPARAFTPEGATYTTERRIDDQLCGGWCSPLHLASTPLCDRYNRRIPACGIPARVFDEDYGHSEPFDPKVPRCSGFEPTVRTPADASVPIQADASVTEPDTANDEPQDETDDAAPASSARRKRSGCSAGGVVAGDAAWGWLTMLSLVGLARVGLLLRRMRR